MNRCANCGYKYQVSLNGEELKNCIYADDKEGFVVCFEQDEDGKTILCNDHVVPFIKYGKVKLYE